MDAKKNPSSAHIARCLAGITGRRHVALDPKEPAPGAPPPDVIVRPANTNEVAAVVQYANATRIPVFPTCGGRRARVRGGILLDLRRMNRILDIDEANLLCRAEPGVALSGLQRALRARGLFFPGDPPAGGAATVGGAAAQCASRPGAGKYGLMRDRVAALEVVLPTGEILHTGPRAPRPAAGCDLARFLLGTRGTLGVFTRLALRLLPLPPAVATLAAGFPSGESAAQAAAGVVEGRIVPVAMEFMDHSALSAAAAYRRTSAPKETRAMLLVELDGETEAVRRQADAVESICSLGPGTTEWRRADAPPERAALWEMRRAVEPGLGGVAPRRLGQTIHLLPSHAPRMLRRLEDIRRRHEVVIALFGRIGDGDLRVRIMYHDDAYSAHAAREAGREIAKAAVETGGAVSGDDAAAGAPAMSPVEMKILRQLKEAFDPNGIMNPDVLSGP